MPNLSRRNFVRLFGALPFVVMLNSEKLGQARQFKVICQKWTRRGHDCFVPNKNGGLSLIPAVYTGYTLHMTERDRLKVVDYQYSKNYGEAFEAYPPTPGFQYFYSDGDKPYECIVDQDTHDALINRDHRRVNINPGRAPIPA